MANAMPSSTCQCDCWKRWSERFADLALLRTEPLRQFVQSGCIHSQDRLLVISIGGVSPSGQCQFDRIVAMDAGPPLELSNEHPSQGPSGGKTATMWL